MRVASRPKLSVSRMKREMPSRLSVTRSAGVVRATTSMWWASSTPVMKVFWPRSTQRSPSRRARVWMWKLLLPASGSVMAKQNLSRPAASGGR